MTASSRVALDDGGNLPPSSPTLRLACHGRASCGREEDLSSSSRSACVSLQTTDLALEHPELVRSTSPSKAQTRRDMCSSKRPGTRPARPDRYVPSTSASPLAAAATLPPSPSPANSPSSPGTCSAAARTTPSPAPHSPAKAPPARTDDGAQRQKGKRIGVWSPRSSIDSTKSSPRRPSSPTAREVQKLDLPCKSADFS